MMEPSEWDLYDAADRETWKEEYRLISRGEEEIELRPAAAADAEEAWREGASPEDAAEAQELSAMSEEELDAELAEELGPVQRWMQDHLAQAEFTNALYPDQIDIDEARLAMPDELPLQE